MTFLKWTTPLDPSEDKDYSLDWSIEMTAVSDTISSSSWVLSAEAIADGLESDQDSYDDTTTTIWVQVNVANQSDSAFDGVGSSYLLTNTIVTAGGRTYERSVILRVKQL